MTIKIRFTASEIEQLKYERYNHPHRRVQRKMEALLLGSVDICKKIIRYQYLIRHEQYKLIPLNALLNKGF